MYAPFSATSKVMHTVADEWLLVNVVDNDYIHTQLIQLVHQFLVSAPPCGRPAPGSGANAQSARRGAVRGGRGGGERALWAGQLEP